MNWVKVEELDLWRVLEDQGDEAAPFHLENPDEVAETYCRRSLIGGMIVAQAAGKVRICKECFEGRFRG